MENLRILTAVEQVAAHLRSGLMSGRWRGEMPGGNRLAEQLGVGRDTVERALRRLEKDGLLINQGRRRPRRIAILPGDRQVPLRIAFLDYEPATRTETCALELLHQLEHAGYLASFAKRSLTELRMDVKHVAREVQRTAADAWLIGSGSRDVLEWFASQPLPAFALFGRMRGLLIAGAKPDKIPAFKLLAERLVELGHRRIVLVCRSERREPDPGETEQALLETLAQHGIKTGPYNLPEWTETPAGFHDCLRSLFKHTPPTALIFDEPNCYFAAQQFASTHGLRVPRDVSLVCTDSDPAFDWSQPAVAHIAWDLSPVTRRVVRWAARVSSGKEDRQQTFTEAQFVDGGTIGPAAEIS